LGYALQTAAKARIAANGQKAMDCFKPEFA
jgi:hypothetical protein